MNKYHYNPTKPHHYILAGLFGAALTLVIVYLTIYLTYFLGGIL